MRRYLIGLVLAALLLPIPASALIAGGGGFIPNTASLPGKWTGPLSSGTGTGNGTSPFALTITSTAGGDLLLVGIAYSNASALTITSITSGVCPGGWVLNPDSTGQNSSGSNRSAFAYCLSDASGQTSLTVTMSSAVTVFVDVFEWHSSGPAIVNDSQVGGVSTVVNGTFPGEAVSPADNDLLIQTDQGCGVSALSGGYSVSSSANALHWAWLPNSNQGAAPLWVTFGAGPCAIMGFAFE